MANPKTPVVGDAVHFFKLVVPHTGPAVGGEIQTHAALVIFVREGNLVDLKVTDREGSTYIARRVPQLFGEKLQPERWNWRRP